MKILDVLNHIDNRYIALPRFQRGYVWNREQVRNLFDSLYHRYPIGSLLVWATQSSSAVHRGNEALPPGIVKLLLDGQQRITTLYGVVRGRPPAFFEGNVQTFTNLMFNVKTEDFEFYQPIKMRDDPLWINVTRLMQQGNRGLNEVLAKIGEPSDALKYLTPLTQLLGIVDVELHVEELTGEDKSLDVVVDIFDRVNRNGTKLSKGDLALAKICADWPEAREAMNRALKAWANKGYFFNLDWLLRSINALLTGQAQFRFLEKRSPEEIQDALKRTERAIDTCLNMIDGRLGLDHDRVLFGRLAIPVMARYIDRQKGSLETQGRDKLLFWFTQAGMWGRFSGATETYIDRDLRALRNSAPLEELLHQLRLWRGELRVQADQFNVSSLGARFYPILYMLTRMGHARDWGTGLALRSELLGKMSRLEVHHIFPKSRLYERQYDRAHVNALANFCFLTKDTNLHIGNRLPEEYFAEVQSNHPGALESQWIPNDPELWRVERYLDFLDARRRLLAEETNRRMADLLHGDTRWLQEAMMPRQDESVTSTQVPGGIASDDEEAELEALNAWVEAQGLPRGQVAFDYSNPETGEQLAVFDLAWPDGVQAELSQPVAVLINEANETLAAAAKAGFRCFTRSEDFRAYIETEISPAGTAA